MIDRLPLKRRLNCTPGGICRVHNAPMTVTTFAGQVERLIVIPIGVAGQLNAKFIKPGNCLWCIGSDEFDGFTFAKVGTCHQRITHVVFNAVGGIKHGGNTALCPVGRSIIDLSLGKNGDFYMRGKFECRGQTGSTTADNKHIILERIFGHFFPSLSGGARWRKLARWRQHRAPNRGAE